MSSNEVVAKQSSSDKFMKKTVQLLEENRQLKMRFKELEEQLKQKEAEISEIAKNYREKQWKHYQHYAPYSESNPFSELAADLILELRTQVEDLREKFSVVDADCRSAEKTVIEAENECRELRIANEEDTAKTDDKFQEIEALRYMLDLRKKSLNSCRKRADRIYGELCLVRRTFQAMLTEPEIRERTILMLSAEKGCVQQALDLELRAVELRQTVQELEDKIAEANAAREEAENILSPDNVKAPREPPKKFPPEPSIEDLQIILERRKETISNLKEELGKALTGKEVMNEALSELTNSNHRLVNEAENVHKLFQEVQVHLTQSLVDWCEKLDEDRIAQLDAERKKEEVELILQSELERERHIQQQLSAQVLLMSYLQNHTAAPDVQLMQQDLTEWLPRSLEEVLGSRYYPAMLAAAKMERNRLIALLKKATGTVEVQRLQVERAHVAFMNERRRVIYLQHQLEKAGRMVAGKLNTCDSCIFCYLEEEQKVNLLSAEMNELRIRCDQMCEQNAEDVQLCKEIMDRQEMLYDDTAKGAEASKHKLCVCSSKSRSEYTLR